jgi:hypothetical protein
MNWLSRIVAWLQSKAPAWFIQNSWVNESIIGVLGTLLLAWRLHSGPFAVILFQAVSYLYERFVDPRRNQPGHNPIDDIGQRAAGSLLAGWALSLF